MSVCEREEPVVNRGWLLLYAGVQPGYVEARV
jgi:hypothetical protein